MRSFLIYEVVFDLLEDCSEWMKPQLVEMKTHPAGTAKKADPITRTKVIATSIQWNDLIRYPELRGDGESDL